MLLGENQQYSSPMEALAHATKHDLIFFEKRSTPKVVNQGAEFTAPESYGKQTKRRQATEDEEKQIANGDWVRVDETGKKGGQPGYKKTKMKGREHLVKHGAEFLEHHGIKGMKWGVRKEEASATRDGRAGDPVTVALSVSYVALMVAPLAVPAAGAVRDRLRDRSSAKKSANVEWKKKPDLTKPAPPMTIDTLQKSVVKPINPKYGKAGTKMNCRRCTMAYEMRRRGYDVKATKSHNATQQDAKGLKELTGTTKHESVWGQKQISSPLALKLASPEQRSSDIFSALNNHPDGARGEITVGWLMGGGHSMAWEKVGGRPVIFDAQSGATYASSGSFTKHAKMVGDAAYTRTDTLKFNEAFLRRWVSNVD